MKKITCLFVALLMAMPAHARYSNRQFKSEISHGVDLVGTEKNIDVVADDAPGALGLDVYQKVGVVDNSNTTMFIPTTMYVRAGAGLNLGFATDYAGFGGKKYESSGSYTVQLGLGWNLSSYVRTEIDAQMSTFTFSDLDDYQANYQTVGGMLYFDFARRYVQTGDVTRMRHFVPFMGLGVGFGQYEFEGADGSHGFVIAAPRATFGFNIMFTDLIGIDIAYQYQMMIGNGFGWGVRNGGVDNISNVIASLRVNF
ncbi:MAG: hypothetical protein J6W40_01265 [Alphaproteobacteria bacterium]|nr:hypothetical protein [Alphaproteobacteria bacterium]